MQWKATSNISLNISLSPLTQPAPATRHHTPNSQTPWSCPQRHRAAAVGPSVGPVPFRRPPKHREQRASWTSETASQNRITDCSNSAGRSASPTRQALQLAAIIPRLLLDRLGTC